LQKAGWKVRVIWACQLSEAKLVKLANDITSPTGET
jgi:G:T-mismatch repair DNA endonuclease (very short patch repair protein)